MDGTARARRRIRACGVRVDPRRPAADPVEGRSPRRSQHAGVEPARHRDPGRSVRHRGRRHRDLLRGLRALVAVRAAAARTRLAHSDLEGAARAGRVPRDQRRLDDSAAHRTRGTAAQARRPGRHGDAAAHRCAHLHRRAVLGGVPVPRLHLLVAAQLARDGCRGGGHRAAVRGGPCRLGAAPRSRAAGDARIRPVPALPLDRVAISGDRSPRAEQLDCVRKPRALGLAAAAADRRVAARDLRNRPSRQERRVDRGAARRRPGAA